MTVADVVCDEHFLMTRSKCGCELVVFRLYGDASCALISGQYGDGRTVDGS